MKKVLHVCFLFLLIGLAQTGEAKNSIAKEWNEEVLHAIRNSRARATVHARNLYHWSVLAYDCWAAYHPDEEPFFLGNKLKGFHCPFKGIPQPEAKQAAIEKAISFASYRFIMHRYKYSPGYSRIIQDIKALMRNKRYDVSDTSTDYIDGDPAHLGNYIAKQLIKYGHQDGANEKNNYSNKHYVPLNDTLDLNATGTPGLNAPNHWQPLQITRRHDQAGNPIKATQTALSPEWGDVDPFALADSNKTTKIRDKTGNPYHIYLDPGPPPYIDTSEPGCLDSEYKWGFCMVSIWQSHLDPADTTEWDVSPGNIGGVSDQEYPEKFKNYDSFYNFYKGGGPGLGRGYNTNPVTGDPYPEQKVKRADYARILAEYWADGVSSETPPGHWYAIYNKIEDDSLFTKQWAGKGDTLNDLAYDVKAYLTLGGAVHDAAVSAWSVKGYYDYVRPVSAIRWMASQGQCSDPNKKNFDSAGIPLIPGYIELVEKGDRLAGSNNQNVGKIKLYTWKGHSHISDVEHDTAGVGWILAGNWWPYQKPSFVTPPFPGYVSGHSTFSRAASRVMTKITGSPYFPGGKSDFLMKKNEFLEHENGPTEDVYLQYAKYKDASDYTSLSRIWGGIHPPADDINGRKMGLKTGNYAFEKADELFRQNPPFVKELVVSDSIINKAEVNDSLTLTVVFSKAMDTTRSPAFQYLIDDPTGSILKATSFGWKNPREYSIDYKIQDTSVRLTDIYLGVDSTRAEAGGWQTSYVNHNPFLINTINPEVENIGVSRKLIHHELANDSFFIDVTFNEGMDTTENPNLLFKEGGLTLDPDPGLNYWQNVSTYTFGFIIKDRGQVTQPGFEIKDAFDRAGNSVNPFGTSGLFFIDMEEPEVKQLRLQDSVLNKGDIGEDALEASLHFSKPMDTSITPQFDFPAQNRVQSILSNNPAGSYWESDSVCHVAYDLKFEIAEISDINVSLARFQDTSGNSLGHLIRENLFEIDTKKPFIDSLNYSSSYVANRHLKAGYEVVLHYDEPMKTTPRTKPLVKPFAPTGLEGILRYDIFRSHWLDSQRFTAHFRVFDTSVQIENVELFVNFGRDRAGNFHPLLKLDDVFNIDMVAPEIVSLSANRYELSANNDKFSIISVFDQEMDTSGWPQTAFIGDTTVNNFLKFDSAYSNWLNQNTYRTYFSIDDGTEKGDKEFGVTQFGAHDPAGNSMDTVLKENLFSLITSSNSSDLNAPPHSIKIYPNPISNAQVLKIKTKSNLSNLQIKVSSVKGDFIFEKSVNSLQSGVHRLKGLEFPSSGVYTILLKGDYVKDIRQKIVVY